MKKKIQKPFDVEAAKRGAKIETRNGMPARIICYDRKGKHHIVALVDYPEREICIFYTIEGKLYNTRDEIEDLVIVEEVEVSKFKVGDWVVRDTVEEHPWLIFEVTPNYYNMEDLHENITARRCSIIDNSYHLWTLKDAKPGDVLICENDNCPFIFKGFSYDGAPSAYCGIDTTNSIYIGTDGPWTRTTVRPATYKERLQFFNKLEEEGYKWDADSLTLSKIQKRWRDDEHVQIDDYFMNGVSQITFRPGYNTCCYYNLFATERQAKSAMAMARISQIMKNDERFGGAISNEEWNNATIYAVIVKSDNKLFVTTSHRYEYLAFHEREQAKLFLEENEDLVKDYYMLD